MVDKITVEKAGKELGDLVRLVVDDVSNTRQIAQFMAEGLEAVKAIAAIGIPAEHKAAVASHIAEQILKSLNESVLALP